MAAPVQARVQAVKDLHNGLVTYERALGAALASARSDLNSADVEFQLAVIESQRRLHAAEHRVEGLRHELARCQEGCQGLANALARAEMERQQCERGVLRNQQAQARFQRAAAELRSSMGTVAAAAGNAIPSGREAILEYSQILTDYLSRQAAT